MTEVTTNCVKFETEWYFKMTQLTANFSHFLLLWVLIFQYQNGRLKCDELTSFDMKDVIDNWQLIINGGSTRKKWGSRQLVNVICQQWRWKQQQNGWEFYRVTVLLIMTDVKLINLRWRHWRPYWILKILLRITEQNGESKCNKLTFELKWRCDNFLTALKWRMSDSWQIMFDKVIFVNLNKMEEKKICFLTFFFIGYKLL